MAKVFKFDAIGRDLIPGEKAAARVFVRKYASPPAKEEAQKEMRLITAKTRNAVIAASGIKAATTIAARGIKAATTVQYDPRKNPVSRGAASGSITKRAPVRPAAKGSIKRVKV